eukprot:Skav223015  [mRNA]  locus=scaffold1422:99981:101909:- [translate_table: standard]
MRALATDRAGASPVLRIAFVTGLSLDPSYFVAWTIVQDVVLSLQRNSWLRNQWTSFFWSDSTRPTYGPFAAFVRVCGQVFWDLEDEDTLLLWNSMRFSLRWVDLSHLRTLFDYAWQQKLSQAVSHRVDFHGLDGINVPASFCRLKEMTRPQIELMNCVQDGTFYLDTYKSKFDSSVSSLCRCGQGLDSLEHRALECPRFVRSRLQHVDVQQMWHALPVSMTHHGLCPENPYVSSFQSALHQIPFDSPQWMLGPGDLDFHILFTDGSCNSAPSKLLQLAGWSVVNATMAAPLASGVLPGSCHSIDRAELWAVIQAIQWFLDFDCGGQICSDSSYACDGMQYLQRFLQIPDTWSNRDLWEHLLQRLLKQQRPLQIRKVQAHGDVAMADSPEALFDTKWNNAADTNAKIARLHFPGYELSRLYSSVNQFHAWQEYWNRRCKSFLLALAQTSMDQLGEDNPYDSQPEDESFVPVSAMHNHQDWADDLPINLRGSLVSSPDAVNFGLDILVCIVQWMLDLSHTAEYVLPITFLEMYVGFYLERGRDLPSLVQNGAQKRWGMLDSSLSRSLGSSLAAFTFAVRLLSNHFQLHLDEHFRTAPSVGIDRHLSAVHCPWPSALANRVSCVLTEYHRGRRLRYARDLARAWP